MDFNENERSDQRCQDAEGRLHVLVLGLDHGRCSGPRETRLGGQLAPQGGAILNQSIFAVTD